MLARLRNLDFDYSHVMSIDDFAHDGGGVQTKTPVVLCAKSLVGVEMPPMPLGNEIHVITDWDLHNARVLFLWPLAVHVYFVGEEERLCENLRRRFLPWDLKDMEARLACIEESDPLVHATMSWLFHSCGNRSLRRPDVQMIAQRLGISSRRLRARVRAVGFDLREVIDLLTVLHSFSLHREYGVWEKVAIRLGYSSGSGLNNLFARLGLPAPSQVSLKNAQFVRQRLEDALRLVG